MLRACVSLFILFWCFAGESNAQCSDAIGCFCFSGYVTCSGLERFPSRFPVDTTMITISNMVAEEIPANVLNTLPMLRNVEIHSSNISRISSAAFSSLRDMDLVSFNEVRVGTIEQGAFFNMTNIGNFAFYFSYITHIESYAFSDIFALDEVLLFTLNIDSIESFAFSNIDDVYKFNFVSNNITSMQPNALHDVTNTYQFSMMYNSFGTLGCNNVEKLIETAYESSFYSNSVSCSCELSWVIDNAQINDQLFLNWCNVPNTTENIPWNFLTRDKLSCREDETGPCPAFTLTGLESSSGVTLAHESSLINLGSHSPSQNDTSSDAIIEGNETHNSPNNASDTDTREENIYDNHTELKTFETDKGENDDDNLTETSTTSMRSRTEKSASHVSPNLDDKDSNVRRLPSEPVREVHIKSTYHKPENDDPVSRGLYVNRSTLNETHKSNVRNESKPKTTSLHVKSEARIAETAEGPVEATSSANHGGYYILVPAEKMAYAEGANGGTNVKCGSLILLGMLSAILIL